MTRRGRILAGEGEPIRRFALVACLLVVGAAIPEQSSAALSLALPRADYPHHTHIVVLPATNAEADHYFGPVHHTSFQRLHRVDGSGWIQAGLWQYTTGRGENLQIHHTVFAYGIHVFRSHAAARRALHDVRLRTHGTRVTHLYARAYVMSAAQETLVFLFFTYHDVLVESYLEYDGAAPASVSSLLMRDFHRQSSALAHLARRLHRAIHQPAPTPTATILPSPTATATSPLPTATTVPAPTATPIPATVIPTPTATATAAGPTLTASPQEPSVTPGSTETVTAVLSGPNAGGVTITMAFAIVGHPAVCTTSTDPSGHASCTVLVPSSIPPGTTVSVQVAATLPDGSSLQTETSFTVVS
ncbi:MAG TPA: hypothetical protein VFB58_03700 [Chloroflexota bacterium]|nr:hypothetical protein [Chloroflexota bacterium]